MSTEVFPSIVVDREVGLHCSQFGVNVTGITKYLRDRGMPEQDILDHTVSFHHDLPDWEDDHAVRGMYISSARTVSVNLAANIGVRSKTEAAMEATSVLVHELDHALYFSAQERTPAAQRFHAAYRQKAQILGRLASGRLARRWAEIHYWNDPVEKRARQASRQYVENPQHELLVEYAPDQTGVKTQKTIVIAEEFKDMMEDTTIWVSLRSPDKTKF